MMTSLRVPVWDDKSIKFAVLSESVQLTQGAFVQIKGIVTSETFERAHECMSNVLYFRMSSPSKKEHVLTLLEKAAMPNLRALQIALELDDHRAVSFVNVLRNKQRLEQVQLCLLHTSEQTTISLFDALSSLPLTALRISFWGNLSQQSVERFCSLLQQKRETLVSLELWSNPYSHNVDLLTRLVSKGLHVLHHLRLLRFLCGQLDELQTQHLCKAMEGMPHLTTLGIRVKDVVGSLTKFFSTSFRPITTLDINAIGGVVDSHLIDLLNALKRNTRLGSLKINRDRFHCVRESGLAEEGFLKTAIDLDTSSAEFRFEGVLYRNRARHAACKRACVTLIAMRRKRGVLKWIAVDVIRMIAMWLWDTRNQSAWDVDNNESSSKKMKRE